MVKATLMNDYYLVRPETAEDKTESGLLVSRSKGERTESWAIEAVVELVPPARGKEFKPALKIGDRIIVSKWDSQLARIKGEDFMVIKEKDILLKLS